MILLCICTNQIHGIFKNLRKIFFFWVNIKGRAVATSHGEERAPTASTAAGRCRPAGVPCAKAGCAALLHSIRHRGEAADDTGSYNQGECQHPATRHGPQSGRARWQHRFERARRIIVRLVGA